MAGLGNIGGSDTHVDAPQTSASGSGQINKSGRSTVTGSGILLDLTRAQVAPNYTNKGNGNLTITNGFSEDFVSGLSGQFLSTLNTQQQSASANLSDLFSASETQSKSLVESITGTVKDALSSIASLAADRQSGDPNASPIPGLSKTFLWLTVAVLVLIGFVWWKEKK